MPPVRGMFGGGGGGVPPLGHDLSMGPVPVVPPGTPPGSDHWVSPHHHHFNRLQQQANAPRHYLPPGGRPSSSPLPPHNQTGGGGMGGGPGANGGQLMPPGLAPPYQDVSDSDSYVSYQPVTSQHGHVEVY